MNTDSLLSLLWWVGIALFFFWMMRRGGCGGMAHGHGGHGDSHEGHGGSPGGSASDKPVDPVCKMGVDPARAVETRLVSGRTLFFCSQTCLDTFDKNPSAYTQDAHAESSHHGQHAGC